MMLYNATFGYSFYGFTSEVVKVYVAVDSGNPVGKNLGTYKC